MKTVSLSAEPTTAKARLGVQKKKKNRLSFELGHFFFSLKITYNCGVKEEGERLKV